MTDTVPFRPEPLWTPATGNGTSPDARSASIIGARPIPDRAMMIGPAADAVELMEATTEGDWVGIWASLLAGLGALVGTGPHVSIGPTRHPLLIWPLLLGATGTGRKGEATSTARRIMFEVNSDFARMNVVTGLSTGEGLIHRLRDGDEDGKDLGVDDKRLVAEEPEFSAVMSRARREGSTLAQVLRDAWEGRKLQTLTKSSGEVATDPHLAVIAHITPREFRVRLDETDLAGGTYNRFLPLLVERSQSLPLPPPVDARALGDVALRLRRSVRKARHQQVPLDPRAVSIWSGLYEEFTSMDDSDTVADQFTRRAAPYCRRVAALLTVLDAREVTTVQDLTAAAALIRYSVASAQHLFAGVLTNPRLDRLRRAVVEAGPTGLAHADINVKLFSRNLPATEIAELVDQLLEDPAIEMIRIPTAGRTATFYRLVTFAKETK